MLYRIISAKLYEHDAENVMYNRITCIAQYITACGKHAIRINAPAHEFETIEIGRTFVHECIKEEIRKIYAKPLKLVGRMKNTSHLYSLAHKLHLQCMGFRNPNFRITIKYHNA